MAENTLTLYLGSAYDSRYFYAVGYFDDLEAPDEAFARMRLVRFDRLEVKWDTLSTQNFNAIGVEAWVDETGQPNVVVAGKRGEMFIQGPTGVDLEDVDSTKILALNSIVRTQEGIAVVGAGSAAHVQPIGQAWNKIFEGLTFEQLNRRTEMVGSVSAYETVEDYMAELTNAMDGYETFYCVAGHNLSSLLIGSDRGRLFYWNGAAMVVLQAATKANLTQIVSVPDGWIVTGFAPNSVVLHVDRDTRAITSIFEDDVRRIFTSVAHHGGKTLIGGIPPLSGGVFEVMRSELVPIASFAQGAWAIEAVDEGLWVLSGKEISFVDLAGRMQSFASPYL